MTSTPHLTAKSLLPSLDLTVSGWLVKVCASVPSTWYPVMITILNSSPHQLSKSARDTPDSIMFGAAMMTHGPALLHFASIHHSCSFLDIPHLFFESFLPSQPAACASISPTAIARSFIFLHTWPERLHVKSRHIWLARRWGLYMHVR